jgi:hypothetical protein
MSTTYIPTGIPERVAQRARYCGLLPHPGSGRWYANGEHIIPEALGGLTEEGNLAQKIFEHPSAFLHGYVFLIKTFARKPPALAARRKRALSHYSFVDAYRMAWYTVAHGC